MSDLKKEDKDRIRRILFEEKNILYDDEWHKSNANMFVDKLNLLGNNINFYKDATYNAGILSINLRMSCFLKELGDKILEREISSGDLESSRQEFMKLVQDVGRNFEILRDSWCLEKPSEPSNKYYEMYRQKIDTHDPEKSRNLDLIKNNMHKDIQDSFNTKYSNTYNFGAGHYLDRLKLRIFLARKLAAIEYFINGSETKVIKPELTDWEIELPPLHSGKKPEIKYGINEDWENYVTLASEWEEWLNGKTGYNEAEMKTLLKVFLRGDGMVGYFEKKGRIWRKVVEKMFGIDIQRNSSALLINAMFFDLVEEGKYKLSELREKLPASVENYDLVSSIIAARMNKPILVQKIENYDLRNRKPEGNQFYDKHTEIADIEKKTQRILYDWLKLKIDEELETKKEREWTDFYLEPKICKVEQLKGPEVKVKDVEKNYGTGVLFHVPTKFFYDLIDEWYAIKIEDLNNDEFLSLYFSEILQIWDYGGTGKRVISKFTLLDTDEFKIKAKAESSSNEECTSQTSQVAPSGSKL